jgi:hypothetical protein
MQRRHDESPLAGSLRGTALVVVVGLLVLAVCLGVAAAFTWAMT